MGDFNGDNYNDRFLGELVNFVASDSFQTMFESFFITHAVRFTDDEEHRLDYYEMYQNFHDLFDKQLEDFCAQQDISHAEFMKRCRLASTEDEKAKHYISILLSSVEYETFVKLMRIMRPVAEMRASAAKTPSVASPKADGKGGAGFTSPAKASKEAEVDRSEAKSGKSPVADAKGPSSPTPYTEKASSK